jgi:hypothetical protein
LSGWNLAGCSSTKQEKDWRTGSADAAMPVSCASNSSEGDANWMGAGRSPFFAPTF